MQVPLQPGTLVEKYRVVRLLGSGGMASVHEVEHSVLGTRHALKVLTSHDLEQRERLVREGRLQAHLIHPNLVPVRDVVELQGAPGLLMDLVDGPSLAALLRAHRPSLDEALALFRGIVAGVAHAHEHGVVHRDLKPGNVLLDVSSASLTPRVADFGLAKPGGIDSDHTETRTGVMMGTPAYAAPEQLGNAKDTDHRADLWALGCILYELLAGRRPFAASDLFALLRLIENADYEPLDSVRPDVPGPLVELVRQLIQPDRELRVHSATDVLDALDALDAPQTLAPDSATHSVAQELATRTADPFAETAAPMPSPQTWAETEGATASAQTMAPTVGPSPSATTDSRRVAPWLAAGAVVALAAGAAVAAWIWTVPGLPPIQHFDDVRLVDGRITGVSPRPGPVGHGGTYRVERDEGGVERWSRVNADGATLPWERPPVDVVPGPTWQNVPLWGFTCLQFVQNCTRIQRLTIRQGSLQRRLESNKDGYRITSLGASDRVIARAEVTVDEHAFEVRHLTAHGTPQASEDRGVYVEKHDLDERGRVARSRWFNDSGRQAMSDHDGTFGYTYVRDEEGRVTRRDVLGPDGNAATMAVAVAAERFSYDDDANPTRPTRIERLGVGDVPIPDPEDQCAALELTWDAAGDLSDLRCFDRTGKPELLRPTLCHSLERSWSDNVLTLTCRDEQGRQTPGADAWSRLALTYKHGRLVERRVVDGAKHEDGLRPTDRFGFATLRLSWNEDGGLLAMGPHDGAAGARPVRERRFSTWRRQLRHGLEVEFVALGPDGAPHSPGIGYAIRRISRDEAGLPIAVSYFTADGKPAYGRDEAHRVAYEFDDRGLLVRERVFDADGKPTTNPRGVHDERHVFDDFGRIIDIATYSADGHPTATRPGPRGVTSRNMSGYHRGVGTRDDRGNLVGLDFFDAQGDPVLIDQGYARVRYTIDDMGNRETETYFGLEGEPIVNRWGVHRWVRRHRPPGPGHKHFEDFTEGLDGQLVASGDRYLGRCARLVYDQERSEDGRVILINTCFGPGGKPELQDDDAHPGPAGSRSQSGRQGRTRERIQPRTPRSRDMNHRPVGGW